MDADEQLLQENILKLATLKAQIKQLEAQEDELATEVMNAILMRPEVDHYRSSFGLAKVLTRESRVIDAAKLIAAGVAYEKISAATTITISKPYVQLYPSKAQA